MTNNTKDKLNELTSLMGEQSTGKCWWSHKWSSWEDTDDAGKILSPAGSKIGRYVYQERRCTRCNKLELNKVTSREMKQ